MHEHAKIHATNRALQDQVNSLQYLLTQKESTFTLFAQEKTGLLHRLSELELIRDQTKEYMIKHESDMATYRHQIASLKHTVVEQKSMIGRLKQQLDSALKGSRGMSFQSTDILTQSYRRIQVDEIQLGSG